MVTDENKGNGAREKVLQYFYSRDGIGARTASQVDHFLMWLYCEGYILAPVPRDEGDEEDALPGAAMEKPEGATIYPLNLFRRRPHP